MTFLFFLDHFFICLDFINMKYVVILQRDVCIACFLVNLFPKTYLTIICFITMFN